MFEKIKAYFQGHKPLRFGTLLRWHALKGILAGRIGPGEKLLDIGSYDGFSAGRIKEKLGNLAVVVIDTDKSGLQAARDRGLYALHASALNLPIADQSLDTVLCLDVIEHVAEDDRLVREIGRVLKSGGKLILTTPAAPIVTFPLVKLARVEAINREWGHVRFGYTLEELGRLFAAAGLTIAWKGRYFNVFSRLAYYLAALSKVRVRGSSFFFRCVIRLEPIVKWGSQEHILVGVKG